MQLRIKEILKSKGLSQAWLADELGMHSVNLNRLINGKIDTNTARLQEIAGKLDVPVSDLFADGASSTRSVTVKGYLQAGAWAETWELPVDEQYDVPVPADESVTRFQLHAGEVHGPSMNRRYPERTVVVWADVVETGEEILPGKRYVVERERADGMREATVKRLWRDDAGALWLLPESDDPRFQEPIPVDGGDDDTVRIVGRVRYAVSRE